MIDDLGPMPDLTREAEHFARLIRIHALAKLNPKRNSAPYMAMVNELNRLAVGEARSTLIELYFDGRKGCADICGTAWELITTAKRMGLGDEPAEPTT